MSVPEQSLVTDLKRVAIKSLLTKSFGHVRISSVLIMEGSKDNLGPEGVSADPPLPASGRKSKAYERQEQI